MPSVFVPDDLRAKKNRIYRPGRRASFVSTSHAADASSFSGKVTLQPVYPSCSAEWPKCLPRNANRDVAPFDVSSSRSTVQNRATAMCDRIADNGQLHPAVRSISRSRKRKNASPEILISIGSVRIVYRPHSLPPSTSVKS